MLAREALRHGNDARDNRRWIEAAQFYAEFLRWKPESGPIHVQLGHALAEQGRLAEAEFAYLAALERETAADTWLQLGRVVGRQGRRDDAITALTEALLLDPASAAIEDELISLSARELVPRGRYESAGQFSAPRSEEGDPAARRGSGSYPITDYQRYRAAYVVPSPPPYTARSVTVLLDATFTSPARVRVTLESLLAQTTSNWNVLVVGPADISDHPVASMGRIDRRVQFRDLHDFSVAADRSGSFVCVTAGAVLNPDALGWLLSAAERSHRALIYADSDHRISHWRDGPRWLDPVFHPMADPADLQSTSLPPAVALFEGDEFWAVWFSAFSDAAARGLPDAGAIARRVLVNAAVVGQKAAHLPLILVTMEDLPAVADRGLRDDAEGRSGWLQAAPSRPEAPEYSQECAERRITVVVPTRDQAELLAICITSLVETARHPGRVRIVVVDNRSTEESTAVLLGKLSAQGVAVVKVDEPFNWSRGNNLAVCGAIDDILLFLNNDTQSLTEGWDEAVCHHLADPVTGVVGAKLLYPDLTIQHAGMVFGQGVGSPIHEGVGEDGKAPGPGGRWIRNRYSAAVTGAFMAVRRKTFEDLGGFDELAFPIGYNDVDFCLKARASGLAVLYAADIRLIHHESKSRGLNDTRGKAAWDQGELRTLHERWSLGLLKDPGVNPHWSRVTSRPFQALVEPALEEVLAWLDTSASAGPWRPTG